MRRFLPIVGVIGAFIVPTILAQDAPACVNSCTNENRSLFNKFGCNSADEAACLCAKPDFRWGIRDCASGMCGGSEDQVEGFLSGAFCKDFPLNAESSAAPEETPAPTSAPAPAPTSEEAATPSATTSLPTTEASDAATTSSTESAAPAETSSSEKSTSDEDNEEDDDGAAGGGLSQGATVGIAIGAGIVFIIFCAIAVAFLLRSRKSKASKLGQNRDISRPMPGVGIAQGGDRSSFGEKSGSSFEMTSNRYEDMLPRQTPRTMV